MKFAYHLAPLLVPLAFALSVKAWPGNLRRVDVSDQRKLENEEEEEKEQVEAEGEEGTESTGDKGTRPEDGFLIKMHYFRGIKWEPRGTDFCVMCIDGECKEGDYVATTHCNANLPNLRWHYIQVEGKGAGLIKAKSEDLCLQLADGPRENLELHPCSKSEARQWFQGFSWDRKFRLHPYTLRDKSEHFCVTMLHHPLAKNDDDGEPIRAQPCYKAARTETVYFEADFREEVKEELQKCKKDDRKKGKCKECQRCSNDGECGKADDGSKLYCYKRGEKGWRMNLELKNDPNAWAKIPGCDGYGEHGTYCVDDSISVSLVNTCNFAHATTYACICR